MKKHISLFMVLLLSSCNINVDIEPVKNKLNDISNYRDNYVVKEFTFCFESVSFEEIIKRTYKVSFEDRYMYYEYEDQNFGELSSCSKHQFWIYQQNDEYVIVDKLSSYSTKISKISINDFTFMELIDDVENKTPVYSYLTKYSSITPYLFLDLDLLVDLVNNNPQYFIQNYTYEINEESNKVEINRNNSTKYIYENNLLKYCEYTSGNKNYLDTERYFISEQVEITYPELI